MYTYIHTHTTYITQTITANHFVCMCAQTNRQADKQTDRQIERRTHKYIRVNISINYIFRANKLYFESNKLVMRIF